MKLSRRAFVKTTAMASAMAMPAISYGRVMGTNDKIRVAVVGVNSRGNKHVEGMKKNVVAICDCDENILGRVADPLNACLLYTSPSPRDRTRSRMPSSA